MSISDDIATVFAEVGTLCTISKPSGTIVANEYIDFKDHAEHTNTSVQGSLVTLTLKAATNISIGDVINVNSWQRVLVSAKQPEAFENTIVVYNASGYVCNMVGKFQTYSQAAGFDSEFNSVTPWVDLYSGIYCPFTNKLYKTEMVTMGGESVDADIDKFTALISNYYSGVVMGCRFVDTTASRNYKVDYVEEFFMHGLMAVGMSEDKRA